MIVTVLWLLHMLLMNIITDGLADLVITFMRHSSLGWVSCHCNTPQRWPPGGSGFGLWCSGFKWSMLDKEYERRTLVFRMFFNKRIHGRGSLVWFLSKVRIYIYIYIYMCVCVCPSIVHMICMCVNMSVRKFLQTMRK